MNPIKEAKRLLETSPKAISKRRKRLVKQEEVEEKVVEGGVPDFLAKNLDIIVVGFNPGLKSSATGHHYAGATNHFYKLLHASKLVDKPITYRDDMALLNWGIGLCNIVDRPTRGSSDLSKTEMRTGALKTLEKLRDLNPKIICFNGMGAYQAATGISKSSLGLQPTSSISGFEQTSLFVVPSSSGRVSHYSFDDKLKMYHQMYELLQAKKNVE